MCCAPDRVGEAHAETFLMVDYDVNPYSGARCCRLRLPTDLDTVPAYLPGGLNIIFYNDPRDAVYKALGVE